MRKKLSIALSTTLVVSIWSFSGCSIFMDKFFDEANDQASQVVQSQVADSTAEAQFNMAGSMYQAYALSMINAYFWAGGYWLAWHPYQPGQWTRWSHQVESANHDNSQQLLVEKAFLQRTADGSEWWRIKASPKDEGQPMIFEALFSADRTQLIRMLAKIGDQPQQEVTFEEGQNRFPTPKPFDEQAFRNNLVDTVELAAADVTYSSQHLRFQIPNGAGQVDFFFSEQIPGGLLKYQFANQQGDRYTIQLEGHGDGATSELGAY